MNTATSARGGEHLPRRLFVASLTLLATALLFDLVDLSTGTGALGLPAYWLAAAGVVGGTLAGLCRLWRLAPTAVFGSPWRLTALPGFFKAVAIALCAAAWSLRSGEGDLPAAGLAMALLGVGFAVASRWLPSAGGAEGEGSPSDPADARGAAPAGDRGGASEAGHRAQ